MYPGDVGTGDGTRAATAERKFAGPVGVVGVGLGDRESPGCCGVTVSGGVRWKPLPGELAPQVRDLIVRLRELKDGLGVSMTALARKTAYSKSSWERYLNGKVLPTRQAVEMLGQLSGTDQARLLATWELAEHAWASGQPMAPSEPSAQPPDTTDPPPRRWRPRRLTVVVAGIATALVACGSAVWLTSAARSSSSAGPSSVRPAGYTCTISKRGGFFYAGHSTTSERLVALNAASQDVIEVQCLLKMHGSDPGRIDGLFGTHTQDAVEKLQRAAGAVVDGIVGPQTWALLRR